MGQKPFNLSAPEWRVVTVLGQHDLLSGSEIIKLTSTDKVRISRTVAELLKADLITRDAKHWIAGAKFLVSPRREKRFTSRSCHWCKRRRLKSPRSAPPSAACSTMLYRRSKPISHRRI